MPRSSARNRESGYAVLLIFLTMSIVAITLYAAMPRVAFEAQRDQEALLIDRGEQYKRAIQLYFRKFRKYPAKIDDLENTNGQRFLRKRYVDPITGKSEWRAIHVGPGGVFLDSLTQKNNQKKKDPANVQNFITELKPMTDNGATPAVAVGIGQRRRPSDQTVEGTGIDPNLTPGMNDPVNVGDNPPGQEIGGEVLPPVAGGTVPAGGSPNAMGVTSNPNAVTNPGSPLGASLPNNSGANMIRNILTSPRPGGPPAGVFGAGQINDVGFINGQPNGQGNVAPTGADSSGSNGFANNNPPGNIPPPSMIQPTGGFAQSNSGNNGFNQGNLNAVNSGVGQPVATGISNTPTQSGSPQANNGAGGLTVGGGIAGFASTAERPGIKVYNERQKYNEWEFIYDFGKDSSAGGGQNRQNGSQANANAGNNSTNSATNNTNSAVPPGSSTSP